MYQTQFFFKHYKGYAILITDPPLTSPANFFYFLCDIFERAKGHFHQIDKSRFSINPPTVM